MGLEIIWKFQKSGRRLMFCQYSAKTNMMTLVNKSQLTYHQSGGEGGIIEYGIQLIKNERTGSN